MLIYHPAFDAYHCVFRMLALIESSTTLEIDRARLLDFYLAFPSAIGDIRLPTTLSHGRRLGKDLGNIYRNPLDSKAVFRDMSQIQNAALRSIAALGLIDVSCYEKGILKRVPSESIPAVLMRKLKEYFDARLEILEFLLKDLAPIPLRGVDGLKHRTMLLEYRYDLA